MKTKKSLIISSAAILLAIVVTIVGVSVAWFGDITHQQTEDGTLYVTSNRPTGSAEFNISSYDQLNGSIPPLVPAKVKVFGAGDVAGGHVAGTSWLLEGNAPLSGASLLSAGGGVAEAATVVPIYFPFGYGGAPDSGAADGKKALKIWVDTAYIKVGDVADNSVNYIEQFYITLTVKKDVIKDPETGVISATNVTSATASIVNDEVVFSNINGENNIYFYNHMTLSNSVLYVLFPPYNESFSVLVNISYRYFDEELNPATINKTIVFGIHIDAVDTRAAFCDELENYL